jgi:putative IMPACT (imprinted ancient) family translation regulator
MMLDQKYFTCECEQGEAGAASKLAEMIHSMGVNNMIVVVSRWWGGILLGPDRFRHINNAARILIEKCGLLDDVEKPPAKSKAKK